jgi:uncharacterized membrane protein
MNATDSRRLAGVDIARGLALLAMFVFHFIWDLAYFGYVDASVPYTLGVKLFGHAIASSFLFIAGVSLVLAHGSSPHWPSFWRRFGIVVAAAALVSLATYVIFPDAFVFFGILHCIAAASLLSAPMLFLPWGIALGAAAVAAIAPALFASAFFDAPYWWWTGLSTFEPATNDYRPLLPWAGAMFAGLAFAKAVDLRARLAPAPVGEGGPAALVWLGRHSLGLYLLHQPAFFAVFTLAALFTQPAPDPAPQSQSFAQACQTQCEAKGADAATCRKNCACVEEEFERRRAVSSPADDNERGRRIKEIVQACIEKNRSAGE